MKTVIVSTSTVFGTTAEVTASIVANGWDLIRCDNPTHEDGGMSDHLANADILVLGLSGATAEAISRASKLKAILKHGVGVDNIDIAAATKRKIPVCNAPGANANAVAELAVGGMLSLARRIPAAHQSVVSSEWPSVVGTEIMGKTLGVIGLGSIGKALAMKARALGMRVIAHARRPDRDFSVANQVEIVEFEYLLRAADYVSLHVTGGQTNVRLIGAKELGMMKPGAYLINYARGEVVDLDALAEALDRGALRGAAIDVYTSEPPDCSHRIFSSSKVVFTPHSGGDTEEAGERVGMMTISSIKNILAGKRPEWVVNPEVYS